MLIEFRAENHRSLKEEQVLSLTASNRIPVDSRVRAVEGVEDGLLTSAVIYGGNASGKSNVLSAIAYMRDAIVLSHRAWDPEGGVPRSPFAWGDSATAPSMYETVCIIDSVKYEYGFVVSDQQVEEEWLYAWPHNRKQVWYEREGKKFDFGDKLDGPNKLVQDATRDNALFLATAMQFGISSLKPLFHFFSKMSVVDRSNIRLSTRSPFLELLFENDRRMTLELFEAGLVDRLRDLFRDADVGIFEIRREEQERSVGNRKFKDYRILFQHQQNDENSWLELSEESEGTKTLFRLAPRVFQALNSGGVLIVDELEASLHPLLAMQILRLFCCKKTNSQNAQLIFTTHDTNLLGTTLGEPLLRRDQIWFTEKDEAGATRLYPLTDYKPRNVENLERGYLQGRYGAIPFVGQLVIDAE
ncbi:MAG: ATP-binding protein [Pirellulaceae bacterium]